MTGSIQGLGTELAVVSIQKVKSAYAMPKSIRMIQPAHRIVGYHSKTTDKNKFARGEGPIGPMQ
jgi:hypothetical protein